MPQDNPQSDNGASFSEEERRLAGLINNSILLVELCGSDAVCSDRVIRTYRTFSNDTLAIHLSDGRLSVHLGARRVLDAGEQGRFDDIAPTHMTIYRGTAYDVYYEQGDWEELMEHLTEGTETGMIAELGYSGKK